MGNRELESEQGYWCLASSMECAQLRFESPTNSRLRANDEADVPIHIPDFRFNL